MDIQSAFSDSYAQARVKFLEAAASAGLAIQSHVHPLTGVDGETLATDVALDAPAGYATSANKQLLLISSACHGVEGHCGSGIQVALLRDAAWRERIKASGVAVLYVHALNPHGFSYSRRVTHENVDLNRNFQDFSRPLPVNTPYAGLHELLLPDTWPPTAADDAALQTWIAANGMPAFQAAVTQGQYAFADGMFFGGQAPTWSNQTVRQVLRDHGQGVRHLVWIDLHTGLGPCGVGERIWAGRDDPAAIARARQWWDNGGQSPVTSIYDGSSTSALLTGLMWMAVEDECPQATYTGMALEYGTLPIADMIAALRADHWLHRARLKGQTVETTLASAIRQQIRDAFYVATPEWQAQVFAQARQGVWQALDGLAPEGK